MMSCDRIWKGAAVGEKLIVYRIYKVSVLEAVSVLASGMVLSWRFLHENVQRGD
jgi:hypothetical protein